MYGISRAACAHLARSKCSFLIDVLVVLMAAVASSQWSHVHISFTNIWNRELCFSLSDSTNHNFKQHRYYYIFHTVSPTDSGWGVEWVEMDNNESHCVDSLCPCQFFNQTHLWYVQVLLTILPKSFPSRAFCQENDLLQDVQGCLEVPLSWVASVIGRCDWGNTPTFKPPLHHCHHHLPEPAGDLG